MYPNMILLRIRGCLEKENVTLAEDIIPRTAPVKWLTKEYNTSADPV